MKRSRGKEEVLKKLEPSELHYVLKHFYAEVKNTKWTDYKYNCLNVMLASLDRHLKEKGYPVSISNGRDFATSKQVLEGKAKQLST